MEKNLNKEYKVNLKYIEFLVEVINKKLENSNKEVLIELYNNIVELKYNNIKRVNFRSLLRKEIKELISNYIKKEYNLEYKEVVKISSKVISILKVDNNRNYLSI